MATNVSKMASSDQGTTLKLRRMVWPRIESLADQSRLPKTANEQLANQPTLRPRSRPSHPTAPTTVRQWSGFSITNADKLRISRVVVSRVVPPPLARNNRLPVNRKVETVRLLPRTGAIKSVGTPMGCPLKVSHQVPLRLAVMNRVQVISRVRVISQRMGLVSQTAESLQGSPEKTATRLLSRTQILRLASPAAASREIKQIHRRRDNKEREISPAIMWPDQVPPAARQLGVLREEEVVAVMGATNRPTVRMLVTLLQNPWSGSDKTFQQSAKRLTWPLSIFVIPFAPVTMRCLMNSAGIGNKPKRFSAAGRRCGRQRQQTLLVSASLSRRFAASGCGPMVSVQRDRCRLDNEDHRPRAAERGHRLTTASGSKPI